MSPGAPIRPGLPDLGLFKDTLHTEFRIDVGDGEWTEVILAEVAVTEARPGWEQFSLLFHGSRPRAFRQGTFTVDHAEVGSFPLFLVAIVTDNVDAQHYEAIFNRPTT